MAGWLGLAAMLAFAGAIHPFLTYPLSLALFAKRKPVIVPQTALARPSLALCMAAFNEEKVIVAKAESLLAMARAYGPATIHVYVDGSTDATAALLAPYADRIDLVVSSERLGKTAGLNTLVARSDSELIAFTDANVIAPANGLVELAMPFGDPTIGCTSARLEYSNSGESPTSEAGSFYWRIEERLKQIESETVGLIGVDGALFMIRRALYEHAPAHLIDDLFVSLIVMVRGFRTLTIEHVVVFERSATHWREEYRRKRRIACQALNVHRALWPRLRGTGALHLYAYISRRPIKWFMPFLLGLVGLFALAAIAVALGPLVAILLALLGIVLVGVGGITGFKPCRIALTAGASLCGVGAGILQSLFSKQTYVVWTPAASVRD
jgi:cellulose synthase/poly-beta-1,6-N-acetylglucosamine synthase-like glycosyltransferase